MQMSKMETYLIIGGTGVMGHFLTRQLVHLGHRPVVLTVSGNTAFVSDIIDQIELVCGDINDAEKLEHIVGEYAVSQIAHLGALLDTDADQAPRRAVQVGMEGMINVLDAGRRHNVKRVVYASSKNVYGRIDGEYWHPTYKPVPEDYPTVANALNMYGIVKLAGEHLGLLYQRQYGLEFIALRFGSTVGPGKLRRHGLYVHHSRMIENAMSGKPTHLSHGADAVHDPIYNADCARGIICALTAAKPASSIFNIGPGYGITLQDFANAVQQVHPGAQITIGPGSSYSPPESAPFNYVLDISRARDELGFQPSFDAVAMVKDYEATMAKLGLTATIT